MNGVPPTPALFVLLGLLIGSAAPAKSLHPDYRLQRGEVQQYGDWLVGCDNAAECTIFGFAQPVGAVDGDGPTPAEMAVRMIFPGQAGSLPVVELFPVARSADRPWSASQRFKLSVGGLLSERQFGYAREVLTEAEANLLLSAYRTELPVAGVDAQNGQISVRFPDRQFKFALRAMQSRQDALRGRIAGEAIYNRPGDLPDGRTMQEPHVRQAATEVIISGFVSILAAKKCDGNPTRNMHRYRFNGGAELWSYECSNAAGTTRSFWHMTDASLKHFIPLDLPEPRDRSLGAGTDGLENAIFDWDFGILRSYQYQQGRSDCGTFRAWGFTNNGWQLIERREMPLCMGIEAPDWIRTHYTPTDGPGPDA